ncbi:hypothetical protein Syun_029277 [Stephania yunnanensis]|uniref:Transmembrane protein n=1 Tax=Stephania yunnanensis TaxID=152371 RepID=A0AAP0E8B4_9MAGN
MGNLLISFRTMQRRGIVVSLYVFLGFHLSLELFRSVDFEASGETIVRFDDVDVAGGPYISPISILVDHPLFLLLLPLFPFVVFYSFFLCCKG